MGGYMVSGGGLLTRRTDELGAKVVVPDNVLALLSSAGFTVEDSYDGGLELTFYYASMNDQIEDALNALAQYITKGVIEFRDDDGEHFRYRFADGNVWYADGEVVYGRETKVGKPLRLYRKEITETKVYEYCIRATSEKEADEIFAKWYEHHVDVVDRDFANTDGEREFKPASVVFGGNPDWADIIDCQQKEEEE